MIIEKNLVKNGVSQGKTQTEEFLHIESACVIHPRKYSIRVYPYNINGYRDKGVKVFYKVGLYNDYLIERSQMIERSIHWQENKENRIKNMSLDYSIRQKVDPSFLTT